MAGLPASPPPSASPPPPPPPDTAASRRRAASLASAFWDRSGVGPASPGWFFQRFVAAEGAPAPYRVPAPAVLARFSRRDALALEAAFKLHEAEIVARWWHDVAESTALAPGAATPKASPAKKAAAEAARDDGDAVPQLPPPPDVQPVIVRGGLYEVDLFACTCAPRYWDGPAHRVQRSTWFAAPAPNQPRIPLPQPLCETLEAAYAQQPWRPAAGKAAFQPDGTFGARVDLREAAAPIDPGPGGGPPYIAALYCSPSEAYLCRDASIGERIKGAFGAQRTTPGLSLVRGYEAPPPPQGVADEAGALNAAMEIPLMDEDTPRWVAPPQPPMAPEDAAREMMEHRCSTHVPSHLVFAVHGIGQRMEGNSVVDSANELRDGLHQQWLAEREAAHNATYRARRKQGLSHADATAAAMGAADRIGRVEVLPVQWRTNTTLDGEWLTRVISPPGARSIRDVINTTVTDVVWYLTPAHRARLQRSLVTCMASLHSKFLAANPYFDGGVSICAHSLGTVIVHDVLSQQVGAVRPLVVPEKDAEEVSVADVDVAMTADAVEEDGAATAAAAGDHRAGGAEPEAIGQQLPFKCRCLVLLGSPLSCFLAMRGARLGATLDASALAGAPFLGAHGGASFVSQHAGDGAMASARAYLSTARPAEWVMMHNGQTVRAGTVCRLPVCTRLFNVFHPNDPVAYRLEPLVASGGARKQAEAEAAAARRPVYVPYHKGGYRGIHVGVTELGDSVGTAASKASSSMSLTLGAIGSFFTRPLVRKAQAEGAQADPASSDAAAMATAADEAAVAAVAAVEALPDDDDLMDVASAPEAERAEATAWERLGGRGTSADPYAGRFDFVMQDALLSSELLSAATAHFAYWGSADVARFVMRALHRADAAACAL